VPATELVERLQKENCCLVQEIPLKCVDKKKDIWQPLKLGRTKIIYKGNKQRKICTPSFMLMLIATMDFGDQRMTVTEEILCLSTHSQITFT
jgi:hypothetical protein